MDDFQEEFEQLQGGIDAFSSLATGAASLYKGMRKEGLKEEVAIHITGIVFGYMVHVIVDGYGRENDSTNT